MSSDVLKVTAQVEDAESMARAMITTSVVLPGDRLMSVRMTGAQAMQLGREIKALVAMQARHENVEASLGKAIDRLKKAKDAVDRQHRQAGIYLLAGVCCFAWVTLQWVLG